jgi:hypothetical protein
MLTIDTTHLPDSMFERRIDSMGEVVYKMKWTLETLINSAGLTFQLRDNLGNLAVDCALD